MGVQQAKMAIVGQSAWSRGAFGSDLSHEVLSMDSHDGQRGIHRVNLQLPDPRFDGNTSETWLGS